MRTKKGIITSAKMQGTVAVIVHRQLVHAKYRKRFRISKKYLADTNGNDDLHEGDLVIIAECKPISKNKHFKVIEVVKRAAEVSELKEEEEVVEELSHEKNKEEEVAETEPKVEEKKEEEPKVEEKKEEDNAEETSTETK